MKSLLSCTALAVALVGLPSLAAAQTADDETVIVTATRAGGGLRRDTLGVSTTSISARDVELRQTRVISDLLRDVPGVAVSRTGGVGGLTNVRIRGAEGNHTLVLIDGMEVADPYQGEFDFAALIADEVARIEVLRGQQSALYGSDAIGGVIHYITLSGAEAPGVQARVEGGSFNTWNAALRAGLAQGPLDIAVSTAFHVTDGTPNARNGVRDLGAENGVISGRVTLSLSEHARIRAVGRYAYAEADVNDQDFDFFSPTFGYAIDSDDTSENVGAYGLVSGEFELLDGRWANTLTLQGVDASRKGFSGGLLASGDEGSRAKASYVSSLSFGSEAVAHTLTGAVDYERETFQTTSPFTPPDFAQERSIETVSYVAQYDLVVADRLGLGAAYRFDANDAFDDAGTYRVQGSYRFGAGTRLHAAVGSGIKNPGYSELYGFVGVTYLGNPTLTPEKSEGWEAGVEQRFFGDQAWIDVTYFSSTLEDEITLDCSLYPLCTPVNLATESEQQGVEVSGQALIGDQWRIFAAYTYLDAVQNGAEEVRRPPHSASVNVSWRSPGDRFGAFVSARYNGEMLDNNFTFSGPPVVALPAYTLVNLGGDLRITDAVEVYARVEDALDESYEDIYTYRSPERSFYVGLRAGF